MTEQASQQTEAKPGRVYARGPGEGEWSYIGETSRLVRIQVDVEPFLEKAGAAFAALSDLAGRTLTVIGKASHPFMLAALGHDRRWWRKHRRRCAICNPASYTPPLKIDGHAYRRRQLARRRRRR